jgi:hypothetical protein
MSTATKVSARDRLLRLPAWFSLGTASDSAGMPRVSMAVYLNRWKAAGLVESFGPRSGVYFNRVLEPNTSIATRIDALRWLYPEAMLIGDTVLHAAGWITQIPRWTHVAIIDQRTRHHLNGVRLHLRGRSWFGSVRSGVLSPGKGACGLMLPELAPAWALADQIRRGESPDPDDIELDEIPTPELLAAGRRIGAPSARMADFIAAEGDRSSDAGPDWWDTGVRPA